MLNLLTLIKREIHDHMVYFLGAVILSAILIGISISIVYNYKPVETPLLPLGLGILVITIAVLGFCVMGAIQMYTDRTRNISAFLLTLPVRRSQILTARIITGFLAILTFLLPVTIAIVFLSRLFIHPIPIYNGMIFEISETILLFASACYCLGLQTAWSSNKVTPILCGLVWTFVLVSLIVVKGFGFHITTILILFIIASLVCIRHKFISTAL